MAAAHRTAALAAALMILLSAGAGAEKAGNTLKMFQIDSPASMSIHEEATISAVIPMMGVFNNLVLYDQNVAQNRPETIVPELATEWFWDEGRIALTFRLRQGV